MSKAPEHFRPFKIEHAKAGAPVSTIDGRAVTFLKWDLKGGTCNILGLVDNGKYGDLAVRWDDDGMPNAEREKECQLVMLPLGMCEDKPVFVGDKLEWAHMGRRELVLATPEMRDMDDLTWPRPEPEYPKTRMDNTDLDEAYRVGGGASIVSGYRALANSAIARAIQDGDVVPASMLEKVAKEVQKAYTQVRGAGGGGGASSSGPGGGGSGMWVNGNWIAGGGSGMGAGSIVPVYVVDIAAIIKRVKEGA